MYIFAKIYYCRGIISTVDDGMNAITATVVVLRLE